MNPEEPNKNSNLIEPEKPDSDKKSGVIVAGGENDTSSYVTDIGGPVKQRRSPIGKIRDFITGLNIYLVLFALVVLLAAFFLFITVQQGNEENKLSGDITELSPEALESLSGEEIRVGDPKSLLTVESHAVFSGSILVRGSLDVAGAIKVGGALSLPGITVSGTSQFDQVQANSLSIAGNTTVQGQMNVQQGLTVNGSGTFSGPISAPSLNIDTLKLSSDLQLNRHIDAGGKTPGVSAGPAVGSGGTVSISGSDTAGTVTINVGSGAPAGVLANITFGDAFGGIPHVVITPVGAGAAAINYYLSSRTSSGFSIATLNAPGSSSFSFDYIVID